MKEQILFFKMYDIGSKCLLQTNNWMLDPQKIPNDFPHESPATGIWSAIFNQLYTDGYIKEAKFNKEGEIYYILSTDGRLFIENGGYEAFFAEQKGKKELNEKQINSVIETNRISRRIGWIALFIAGAAASASIAQYFKKSDELIQPSLDKLNREVKLLRESLQKEVSNLKTHSIDTLNVRVSK